MSRNVKFILKGSGGFTLLEVVVAVALSAMILVVAGDISWRVWGAVNNSKAKFDSNVELHNGMYWVTNDLRKADAVEIITPTKLRIQSKGNEVLYYDSGGSLVREYNGSKRIVARNITGVGFSADSREGGVLVNIMLGSFGKEARTSVWVYTE